MPSSKTDEMNGQHQEPAATATPGIIKPVLVEKLSRYLIKALGEESSSAVKEASSSCSTKTAANPKSNSNNSFPLWEMASQAVSNFLTEHESHHIQDHLITLLKPQMSAYLTRDRYTGRRSTAHDHLVIFSLLDDVFKNSVIHVLSEPWYRNWVKGSILNNTSYYYRKELDDFSKRRVLTPADSNKNDLSSIAIDEADSVEDCPNYE